MSRNNPAIKDIYSLIDLIRLRPGMYIGEHTISTMRSFLDGYIMALWVHDLEEKEEFPPFGFFHDWAMKTYGWGESTAGWNNIILEENGHDEKKSLDVFFELVDGFKTLYPVRMERRILNAESMAFHHSEKCTHKYTDGRPIYEQADEVFVIEFSHDFGASYFVRENGYLLDFSWRTRYDNLTQAKQAIADLFGEGEWQPVHGDLCQQVNEIGI